MKIIVTETRTIEVPDLIESEVQAAVELADYEYVAELIDTAEEKNGVVSVKIEKVEVEP